MILLAALALPLVAGTAWLLVVRPWLAPWGNMVVMVVSRPTGS